MRARLLALLLASTPAIAQDAGPTDAGPDAARVNLTRMVDEAIRNLARARNDEGLRAMDRRDFPAALRAFGEAWDLDPTDDEITNNLAYLYDILGNRSEAERMYRRTLALNPRRGIAYANFARLLAADGASADELDESARLLVRARELKGNVPEIILLQARVASRRGHPAEAERHYLVYLQKSPVDDALALELGDFHNHLGRADDALRWYRRVSDPDGLLPVAARRIRELEIEREARRYGWTRPSEELSERSRRQAEQARSLSQDGRHEEAVRLLREVVARSPRFAEAHADLGDALRALGRAQEAELALLRAAAIEPGNADILSRVADFLAEAERPAEAVIFLTRALDQRPDWADLRFRLARAHQAAGDLPRALHQVVRFLDSSPDARQAAAARELERALQAALPAPTDLPEPPAAGDRTLVATLSRARALAKDEPEAAMAQLRALPDALRGPEVLNLEGRILQAAGRLEAAAQSFETSLTRRRAQPDVLEVLGALRVHQGRVAEGRALLAEAEGAGVATAGFALARLAAERPPGEWPEWIHDAPRLTALQDARDRLARFLATEPSRYREEAETLLVALEARVRAIYAGGATSAGLLLLLGLGVSRRLWGGADLGELVTRHPESGPEVQRILSAIRHEVLKHNTMVLTGLVDAIEQGEDVGEKAEWARQSLLGAPGEAGAESAARRLQGYAARLGQLGRAHGYRLNLRRKDPALSALLRGFRTLRRAAPLLDRADRLGAGGRARLLRALQQATQLLNVEGYEAVRALLDRLRMLAVDEPLLRAVFERTRREPALAGAPLAPLDLELRAPLPCRVAAPRHAFDDILTNLVRNAIQSSVRHHRGDEPIHIGLLVDAEVDFITGLERAVFAIRDRSPQKLTPEMLRGRYIEEGLGLTADLVSRYEGTLDVLDEQAPWTKAVVVKLPRIDESEEEEPA